MAGADVNQIEYERDKTPWKREQTKPDVDNSWDQRGFQPLHLAARWGHIDIIKYLMDNGADPSAVDDRGRSAVHWAAYRSQLESIRVIAKFNKNKVDMNIPDDMGYTPLHIALQELSFVPVIKLLLSFQPSSVTGSSYSAHDSGLTMEDIKNDIKKAALCKAACKGCQPELTLHCKSQSLLLALMASALAQAFGCITSNYLGLDKWQRQVVAAFAKHKPAGLDSLILW